MSKYHLYNKRDDKAVSNMMTEIATQTSYLFYSGQEYTKVVSSPDGQVRQMKLSYMKTFRKADGAPDRTKIQRFGERSELRLIGSWQKHRLE